jgi:hypothetical protein
MAHEGVPIEVETPFGPYVPYVNGPAEGDDSPTAQAFSAQQSTIAACMKERGFEYTPLEWAAALEFKRFPEGDMLWLGALPPTQAEAEAKGYGRLAPPSLDLGGPDNSVNDAHRNTLSESARTAYDTALGGPPDDPYYTPPVGAPVPCRQVADQANPYPQATDSPGEQFDAQFQELVIDMHHLVSIDIWQDPAVRALNTAWNDCMTDQGLDLTAGDGITSANVTPWAAWTLALRTKADGTPGDSWFHYESEQETPPEERSLLGTKAELSVAAADFRCREATQYQSALQDAQLRLEAEFVTLHRDELDAMKAFVEGASHQ